jgi:hypothetical protein
MITMNNDELIRSRGGVELPAAGCWRLHPGSPLRLQLARWVGRHHRMVITTRGALQMDDGGDATITLDTIDDSRGERSSFHGELVEADRLGRWTFSGTLMAPREPAEMAALLFARYDGVYRGGIDHAAVVLQLVGMRDTSAGARRTPFELTGPVHFERTTRRAAA